MKSKRCSHCGEMKPLDSYHLMYRDQDRRLAACIECRIKQRDVGRSEWCCKVSREDAKHANFVRVPDRVFEELGEPTHVVWSISPEGVDMKCKYAEDCST